MFAKYFDRTKLVFLIKNPITMLRSTLRPDKTKNFTKFIEWTETNNPILYNKLINMTHNEITISIQCQSIYTRDTTPT